MPKFQTSSDLLKCPLKIEHWPIDRLIEYARNPRKNDAVVDKMVSAIKEFGFRIPIVAKSDGSVVDGHLRLKAARKLGMQEVPVALADELTDTQVKAFRLLANRSVDWAEWDNDLLRLELDELKEMDIDLELTGFELDEIKEITGLDADAGGLTDPDDVPEVQENEPPVSKTGDIWILGNHRLMCGDSTDAGSVALLMAGQKADMVFTDPPYGMKKEKDGVINDNLNYDDLLEFNKKWISISFDILKENGSWYCWGIDEPLMDIYAFIIKPLIKAQKATFRNLITWDKNSCQGMSSDSFRMYPRADEKCLFIMAGVQGFNNNADNYFEGWEPVRNYLFESRKAMGWDVQTMKRIVGHSDLSRDHWTGKSQFNFPTREVYTKLQEAAEKQRKEKGMSNDAFRREYNTLKREYDTIKREYYSSRAYFDNTHEKMTNVWRFDRINSQEREAVQGHPTPKPIKLCIRGIKTSTVENNIVLDLFGGSGTTLIACEQTNRQCRMMELDPHYCDVIIKRWQDFTGQKAVHEASGKNFDEYLQGI